MTFRFPVTSLFAWIAAILVALAPAFLAADHGGILPRTQWAAAVVALVAIGLAIPVTFARQRATGLRPHFVAILLILAAGVAVLQMTPFPAKVVNVLSSGSASAYQQWLAPLSLPAGDSQPAPTSFSVSIAPWLTAGYAAMFIVAAGFAWVASTVFTSRQRITLLLLLVLATGSAHSALGFYQLLHDASVNVWGVDGLQGGSPFGAFTNRNNSAVLINLGLGCSLGLLAWRLAALTGYQLAGGPIPPRALTDLFTDRTSILAILGGVICGAGLVASGSRGGLAGGIAGTLLAFGLVSSIRRGRGLISLTIGVGLITAVLMVRFDLPHKTLDRLGATGDGLSKSIASDGRLDHWPDGIRAGNAYFPAGAGAGTYRFAYLPYQQSSHPSWFVNADNLWLEWFVEMGLLGLVLLFLFLLATSRALIGVNASPDALDHGLATAGWFALGSIAVTQFFDFGLSLLPAAILAAVLFSAVITRHRELRPERPLLPSWLSRALPVRHPTQDRGGWLYRFVNHRASAAVALGGLAIAVFCAQSALALRMSSQAIQRRHRQLLAADNASLEDWEQLIDDYQAHLAHAPLDAVARLRLAEAELLDGRLRAAAASSDSVEMFTEQLQRLSPRVLRSAWYERIAEDIHREKEERDSPALSLGTNAAPIASRIDLSLTAPAPARPDRSDENSNEAIDHSNLVRALDQMDASLSIPLLPIDSEEPLEVPGIGIVPGSLGPVFHRVRSEARTALEASPLADEPRYLLAQLDFSGGSPKQSRELLVQIGSLRRQNGVSLRQIGQSAATSRMWDLTASFWKRALRVAPQQTAGILAEVHRLPVLKPRDVVPTRPDALMAAAKFELRRNDFDPELLDRAVEVLAAQVPGERQAKREHLELLAQIAEKRGNHEAAVQHYRELVALYPGDANTRYRFANALAATGETDEARQQARTGRQLATEDMRFDALIKRLRKGGRHL